MNEEDFKKALERDPSFLEKLRRRTELAEFKEKYHLLRASPFKCPNCKEGTLWISKVLNRFTCRKCLLEFDLECISISTEELILKLREIKKEFGEYAYYMGEIL